MANTNTDLTEEDAADLQFPKVSDGNLPSNVCFANKTDFPSGEIRRNCSHCFSELVPPYIMCVKCNIPLCSTCFSNGTEFSYHKNDHDYQVYNGDFMLFENSDWTAKEELVLLESLLRYGNWKSVANELPKKNIREIKDHYDYFYLKGQGSNLLPKIKETEASVFPTPIVPYRFKFNNIEEPPRFLPNTIGYSSLAGYNSARSDFECDYDASAEDLLSNLKTIKADDPHYNLLVKLQCGVVESYNRKLKQRARWKCIMREHGLILTRKCISWLSRYERTITKPVYTKLTRFMQLCRPEKFEYLLEGLHRIGELKIHILRLCNFRLKGITTLGGAQLYSKLNQRHEEYKKTLKAFQKSNKYHWKTVAQNMPTAAQIFASKRRSGFSPLEIVGLPGYYKLSLSERELCSNVRLVPTTYFDLKTILIAENKKLGSLKLQTARRLLKIDVNKTRKLYDFLVDEGHISKPP